MVPAENATPGPRLPSVDACCAARKVEPNGRALAGKSAWIAGLRRDQSKTREEVLPISWDAEFDLYKLAPLYNWTEEDCWAYVKAHDVPVNPLHAQGYASIGCTTCTRPVAPGEDLRAGRWDGEEKTECGLHLKITPAPPMGVPGEKNSPIIEGTGGNPMSFVLWLTGLSGAGKSTLSAALAPKIRERFGRCEVLDGDEVREFLSKGLGFSKEDRDTNVLANRLRRESAGPKRRPSDRGRDLALRRGAGAGQRAYRSRAVRRGSRALRFRETGGAGRQGALQESAGGGDSAFYGRLRPVRSADEPGRDGRQRVGDGGRGSGEDLEGSGGARMARIDALRELEDEAIFVLREAAAQFENPVVLFSGGKDSIVVSWLARKAFWPAKMPFSLLHIDTEHNFPEAISVPGFLGGKTRRAASGALGADQHRHGQSRGGDRPDREPQRAPDRDPGRCAYRAEDRLRDRRRPPRRRESPRQGALLLPP